MQYYLFLLGATLLYSVQFVFLKYFQKVRGTGPAASIAFSGGAAAVLFVVLLCVNGLRIAFSPFSLGVAALYAAAMIGMNVAGIKSLGYVSLSLYTLFSMLGGMLLPLLYGVCTGEAMTWMKGVGLAVLAAALLLAVRDTGKPGLIGALCCAGVFVLNGCFGIFTKWHQSSPLAVPTLDFMLLYSALTAAASALLVLPLSLYGRAKKGQPFAENAPAADGRAAENTAAESFADERAATDAAKCAAEVPRGESGAAQSGQNVPTEEQPGRAEPCVRSGGAPQKEQVCQNEPQAPCGPTKRENALSWASVAGYAAVNGGAQLIVMLCARHVDASVQYPIITGGCILFSVLTGLLFGERVTLRAILRAALALAGTLLFMF